MSNLDVACLALIPMLSNLSERGLSIGELRILMVLNAHGDQKRSTLMARAGFRSHNQNVLLNLIKTGKIDRVNHRDSELFDRSVYKYAITLVGLTALKRALKEVTG